MLNEDILIEVIHKLSPSSAAGLDFVSSSLLVNYATELAHVLWQIFRSLFFDHFFFFPKSWKRFAIIPIYKFGDKIVPSNYRPISLTSLIYEVLDNILENKYFCAWAKRVV